MTKAQWLKQWFAIAKSDLITAKRTFEDFYPKELAISCFHCQQCAEKSLKGFLQNCDIEPPKIHNLTELCEMCITADAEFIILLEISSRLTEYGVASRYPSENAVDESITKTNIERAQTIYTFCLSKTFLSRD
jgi:HEPN domain-containing protein